MFKSFLRNHALANLAFLLVLAGGIIAYGQLSREQDPNVNFNWVDVITILPGASASDVEKRITDPLERAVRRIRGIKFRSPDLRDYYMSPVSKIPVNLISFTADSNRVAIYFLRASLLNNRPWLIRNQFINQT